ncbi:MAG: hypothetical protein A2X08_03790 [Bacteroidetes bacterium GWA2_32_17]|nr:MAG: hypothetical protein A2X08_03790 [Bacteroidetes bacterium GWA2_32_17]
MILKKKYRKIRLKIINTYYMFKSLPWKHICVLFFCLFLTLTIFYLLSANCFKTFDTNNTLTNLLTVNAVFSAILITYLFSRITWSKERKLEVYKEANSLSQKITDFRRILNKLTTYYNIWDSDNSTKSLIDHGEYRQIDFYDYRMSSISDYEPHNQELINEFRKHKDYNEGISTLYLAMVSLVRNRNNPHFEFHEELYSDFELNGLYNIKVIEKWLNCEIFGMIWFWLDKDRDNHFINYIALRNDNEFILEAAKRINKKYEGQELNNKLLKELSEEFNSHYLKELYIRLKELKKGVTDLNLLIIVLITISLFFGVLLPFALLLVQAKTFWFSFIVAIVASINTGLIAYFILRFPTLINRELKWT